MDNSNELYRAYKIQSKTISSIRFKVVLESFF